MNALKKLAYSFLQILVFICKVLGRKGTLRPGVIKCGWPGSKWQSKFLVVGIVKLKNEEIFTELDGHLYPLDKSPQIEMLRKLAVGVDISKDFYFTFVKELLSPEDFQCWMLTKEKLVSDFDVSDETFNAVVIYKPGVGFVVEDGAHRLALRSLSNQLSHLATLSVWSFR